MPDVLVFVEQRAGQVKKAGLEALSEGRRLAGQMQGQAVALLVGFQVEGFAADLAAYGAQKVLVADAPQLELYSPTAYAKVLADAVQKTGAKVVLMGATAMGKDLAANAAARLSAGCATDCVAFAVESGRLVARRPVYAGKAIATVRILSEVAFATTRPNAFPARKQEGASAASTEKLPVPFAPEDLRVTTREVAAAAGARQELSEAEIVVAGGRGLKSPENFKLVEDLAAAFGAALGASRAVVDAGWRPHAEQVGQTGKTVAPGLYVACGISGAIQHLAGMSSSKVIVAINTDKDAPIFKVATYGIVGDALQVMPALAAELKKQA